jgi:transposase
MRGGDERSGSLFSYVDLEARVGKDHSLRIIRRVVNEALAGLSGEFSALYSRSGRPSIPPEKLLRAMLLQAFYSIRSERQLMERLEFDLLFRWFVGIGVDDAAWDHSTFSKNRTRLLEGDIAAKLLSGDDATASETTAQYGSFLGRRDADRGLGVDEEFPAEGRFGRAVDRVRRAEPQSGFPWPEALQRDARFDD